MMIIYARRRKQVRDWSIQNPALSEHKHIISEECLVHLTSGYMYFFLFERSIFIPVKADAEFVCCEQSLTYFIELFVLLCCSYYIHAVPMCLSIMLCTTEPRECFLYINYHHTAYFFLRPSLCYNFLYASVRPKASTILNPKHNLTLSLLSFFHFSIIT